MPEMCSRMGEHLLQQKYHRSNIFFYVHIKQIKKSPWFIVFKIKLCLRYLFPELEDVFHVDDGSNLNFPAIPISLSNFAITIINQIAIFANNFSKPSVNKSIKCYVNERNIDPLPIEKNEQKYGWLKK